VLKLGFPLAPLMYCGNRFGFDFAVAGLRWARRSRRLHDFGAELAQSTQPHQNHKPVFAEYRFLEKRKKVRIFIYIESRSNTIKTLYI
jgi:hypothetical protein